MRMLTQLANAKQINDLLDKTANIGKKDAAGLVPPDG